LPFWAAGLLPHFRGENECLLARLVRHFDPEHELVRRTQWDHLGIEALVAEMRDTRNPGKRKEALVRFGHWLRAHVRWEEDVLFEETRRMLGKAEMQALASHLNESLPKEMASPWPGQR
jgi:hemerythrin superfamily protein